MSPSQHKGKQGETSRTSPAQWAIHSSASTGGSTCWRWLCQCLPLQRGTVGKLLQLIQAINIGRSASQYR